MSFIVVGSPLDLPGPHRQKWLGAIKCLNLALFIDTQDQRKLRWVEIEPNDIAHLFNELRVGRELEGLDPVRLQRERLPDPLHRRGRHSRHPCHIPRAPMRGVCWLRLQRLCYDLLDEIIADLARCPAAWLVRETAETVPRKPTAPGLYRLACCSNGSCDGAIAVPRRRQQNNLGAHRIPTRNLATADAPLQLYPLGLSEYNLRCSRHASAPESVP